MDVIKIYNLEGQKFGRLTVIERHGSDKSKQALWLCRCDCGTIREFVGIRLRSGETQSCGCLHREKLSKYMKTHGESRTRLYRVWAGMKNRCYNQKADNYRYYGGIGITMCDEWKNSYEAFRAWSIQNGYDENEPYGECTIDRIDVSEGYSPDNCRWVDHVQQCNNQSSNKMLTYNGKTMTMSEWAREVGIKYTTLRARIRRGWSVEDALRV